MLIFGTLSAKNMHLKARDFLFPVLSIISNSLLVYLCKYTVLITSLDKYWFKYYYMYMFKY